MGLSVLYRIASLTQLTIVSERAEPPRSSMTLIRPIISSPSRNIRHWTAEWSVCCSSLRRPCRRCSYSSQLVSHTAKRSRTRCKRTIAMCHQSVRIGMFQYGLMSEAVSQQFRLQLSLCQWGKSRIVCARILIGHLPALGCELPPESREQRDRIGLWESFGRAEDASLHFEYHPRGSKS